MSTWIPVEYNDRPKGPVLVWDGCDQLIAVRLCPGWYEITTAKLIVGVTHWTTLPEPPSEAA